LQSGAKVAALAVTLLYSIATLFSGFMLMRVLGHREIDQTGMPCYAVLTSSFILGLGVMSAVWLFLGLAARLTPLGVLTVLAGVVVGGVILFRRVNQGWMGAWREFRIWYSGLDSTLRMLLWPALGFLGLLALQAFVRPPVGDAEAFYMVYPKIIAASQRIAEMPGPYANFSQIALVGELNFAALYILGGVQSAKLFVWPVALAAILMLVAVGDYAGLGKTGLCFVILLVATSTAFTNHITDGKVDLFAAAIGVGAVYWALRTAEPSQAFITLCMAGILTGFAVTAKLSYIPALLPPLALLLGWNVLKTLRLSGGFRATSAWQAVRSGAVFGLWFGVGALPMMIKNAVLFEAPLAPFIGAEGNSWLNQVWFSDADTQWIVMTYPLALVFGKYPMQDGNLSILFLAFAPLVCLLPEIKSTFTRPLIQVTCAGIFGTASWVFLRPSIIAPRYLLATLFLFAPMIAFGAERVYLRESRPRIIRVAMVVTVAVAILIASSPQVKLVRLPGYFAQSLLGTLPGCVMASGYCEPLTELNRLAKPGERVYFVGYYSYWLRSDLLQCLNDKRDAAALANVDAGQSQWETLYARGFHYVIIDKVTHIQVFQTLMDSPMPPWLELSELVKTDGLSVYALKPRESGHPVEWSCSQIASPAWEVTRKAA